MVTNAVVKILKVLCEGQRRQSVAVTKGHRNIQSQPETSEKISVIHLTVTEVVLNDGTMHQRPYISHRTLLI